MKYVALLSGGKDSCYNLLHCQKNGHDLVAAASLRPEQGKDEIDSYMYQTVGQDAIEVVAKALDVPLYRQVISGGAVHMGNEYGARSARGSADLKGDETEDLYELLSTVLKHHPEVKGVSVGAILSNYQRVRVEHVCSRLGLTNLAYLWQRDQADLLSEMIQAGLTAVLIKVAGIGLTTKHLGKTLQEMQPHLTKLNTLYGSHVCGEGGEYETLTIDSPMFKSRILLKEVETVIHSDSDFATVAYLRVKKAELEAKNQENIPSLPVPPMLDERYSDLLDEEFGAALPDITSLSLDGGTCSTLSSALFPSRSLQIGDWVSISSVQRTSDTSNLISIEEEVRECFQFLSDELKKYNLELHHCANINIFLSSIDLFLAVNAIYSTFFGTSPPARACVAVDLPQGIRVRLDVIAFVERNQGERHAHHVQGLSYWAPANIGPYSQAILAQERVFVSGQIGLIPRNLTLADTLQMQAALACQHADRILDALASNTGSNWNPNPQLNVWWFGKASDLLAVKSSRLVQNGGKALDLFAAVSALPKGAKVEKQTLIHTGRSTTTELDTDPDEELTLVDVVTDLVWGVVPNSKSRYQSRTVGTYVASVLFVKGVLLLGAINQLTSIDDKPLNIRLFYNLSRASPDALQSALRSLRLDNIPTTDIPCTYISSRDEDNWDYAICILSHSGASQ